MIYPREAPSNVGGDALQYHFYISSAADLANLPDLDKAAPGSDAYSVDTQTVYILDAESGQWEAQ
jgi:hypothetical protein